MKKATILLLVAVLLICAGCSTKQSKPTGSPVPETTLFPEISTEVPTKPIPECTPEETVLDTEEPTASALEIEELAQSYTVEILRGDFPIYGAPGYDAPQVGTVEIASIYTIVAEYRHPDGTLWGRLKSGAGWVDLDLIQEEMEAAKKPLSKCPYLYTLKDAVYEIYTLPSYAYGSVFVNVLHEGIYTIVEEQYDAYGNLWGKLKSGIGWIRVDLVDHSELDDWGYGPCKQCGVIMTEFTVAFEGFGLCCDCYYANLNPEYICDNCGCDCSFSGTIRGLCQTCFKEKYQSDGIFCAICQRGGIPLNDDYLCDSCAASKCSWCGGPLSDDHDCDDYPNIICSNCGWGTFETGVGAYGIPCPDCGEWVIEPVKCIKCYRDTVPLNDEGLCERCAAENEELNTDVPWKIAYWDYIMSLGEGKDYLYYRLVHVDSDGIPELFVQGGTEAEGSYICSYKNGQVVEVHLRRLGGASFIPGSGLVHNFNGNMGYYTAKIYRLDSDGFTQLFYGSQEDSYEEIINESGEPEYITHSRFYIFDGSSQTEVSEEEFFDAQSEIFDFNAAEGFGYYDDKLYSFVDIKKQIINW